MTEWAIPEDVKRLLGDDAVYCESADHGGGGCWHHKHFHGGGNMSARLTDEDIRKIEVGGSRDRW